MAFERPLAEHLLARLRGAEPAPPETWLPDEDPDAPDPDAALARAHLERLDARARSALALERARVPLEGSELDLDEAERTLARKEERRLFAPLRDRLHRALLPFDEVERDAAASLVDELELEEPGDARLDALLARLKEPAQVALALLGSEVPRALDPVDPAGGFSGEAARALSRAALDVAPTAARGLVAVRAPRLLAGQVISRARGPARVLICSSLRGARFARLLEGRASALAASLLDAGGPAADRAAALVGSALALGLSAAVVRKAVLNEAAAEDNARALAARELLDVYVQATAAAHPAEARDRLGDALGVDLDPGLRLPWPGFGPLSGPRAAVGGRALRSAQAAHLFRALRERFDEAFPLVPGALELFAGARGALSAGDLDVHALFDLEPEAPEATGEALVANLQELV